MKKEKNEELQKVGSRKNDNITLVGKHRFFRHRNKWLTAVTAAPKLNCERSFNSRNKRKRVSNNFHCHCFDHPIKEIKIKILEGGERTRKRGRGGGNLFWDKQTQEQKKILFGYFGVFQIKSVIVLKP